MVGEYSTWITDSEHTCSFNVPVPMEKVTPLASCWTFLTGFIAVHCAFAALEQNIESQIPHASNAKDCTILLSLIKFHPGKTADDAFRKRLRNAKDSMALAGN